MRDSDEDSHKKKKNRTGGLNKNARVESIRYIYDKKKRRVVKLASGGESEGGCG